MSRTLTPIQYGPLERRILDAAEDVFAIYGYHGTTLSTVAEQVGISKQNLLYYFNTKEILYRAVLKDVFLTWLDHMEPLANPGGDPLEAITTYIRAKLQFSRKRPSASKVFANEVIAGMPHFRDVLAAELIPRFRDDVAMFNRWIAEGRMDPIDPIHLMFIIWAATQTYADFSAQMGLLLNKKKLSAGDFDLAEQTLTRLIVRGIGLDVRAKG